MINPGELERYFQQLAEQDINVILLANIINGAWEPIKTIHRLLKAD